MVLVAGGMARAAKNASLGGRGGKKRGGGSSGTI